MQYSFFTTLALMFTIFNCLSAQDSLILIKNQVLDQHRNPIEYANIWIKNTPKGVLSDSTGYFEIEVNQMDTLLISYLGYKTQTLAIKKLPKKIVLIQKAFATPTAVVHSGKAEILDVGFNQKFEKKNLGGGGFCMNCRFIPPNLQVLFGQFIENPSNKSGYFQSVSFYLHQEGRSKYPFRVRIFEKDTLTDFPNKDLLDTSIIVTPIIKEGWVKIDLTPYRVIFPKNGAIVAFEWIPNYTKKYGFYVKWKNIVRPYDKEKWKKHKKIKAYGQILAHLSSDEEHEFWARIDAHNWKSFKPKTEKLIKAKVKVFH